MRFARRPLACPPVFDGRPSICPRPHPHALSLGRLRVRYPPFEFARAESGQRTLLNARGAHPHALRLDSLRSLAAAAGAADWPSVSTSTAAQHALLCPPSAVRRPDYPERTANSEQRTLTRDSSRTVSWPSV